MPLRTIEPGDGAGPQHQLWPTTSKHAEQPDDEDGCALGGDTVPTQENLPSNSSALLTLQQRHDHV